MLRYGICQYTTKTSQMPFRMTFFTHAQTDQCT